MPTYKTTYDTSHALIVAIDEYEHLPPLSTAVRGANAFEELLRTSFDFQSTTRLINGHATQKSILEWFISRPYGPDDRVLFYFAGHGLTRQRAPGSDIGYLALSNTDPANYASALRLDHLLDEAVTCEAKHVMLLLDSCFSGLAVSRDASFEEQPFDPRAVADRLISRRARYAITAGGAEAVDDNLSPDGKYSLFTYYLLRGLQGGVDSPGGLLRAGRLAAYLEDRVGGSRRSHHKPRHTAIEGSEGGEFVFWIPDHLLHPGDTTHPCEIKDPQGFLEKDSAKNIKLKLLQQMGRTSRITLMEEITTGKSGSAVYLVNVDPYLPGGPEGLHFCKIYRTKSGEEKEIHEKVRKTSIGQYVPALVDSTPLMDGWMASLYAVAHNRALRGAKALRALLNSNIHEAHANILKLLDLLKAWNPSGQRDSRLPWELIALPLRRFEVDQVVTTIEGYIPSLNRNDPLIQIQFSKQSLPNPLAFILYPELWKGQARSIVWPEGHIHGDLHGNNVICPLGSQAASQVPIIIDFDTFDGDNHLFYDLAYLELDIILAMVPSARLNDRETWVKITEQLTGDIELGEYPPGGPEMVAIHTLIRPIRAAVWEKCKEQPDDYEAAFWIARTSAGLEFARKRKIDSAERRLALLLAAQSLAKVLDVFGIEYKPKEPPLWMTWHDDADALL